MNRQSRRRRPDWPVTVYAYKIHPQWAQQWLTPETRDDLEALASAGLPPAVWHEAQRMQETWNVCVVHCEANRAAYDALQTENPAVQAAQQALEEAMRTMDEAKGAVKVARGRARKRRLPGLEPLTLTWQHARGHVRDTRLHLKEARQTYRPHIREQAKALRESLQRQLYETIQTAPIYWAHKLLLHDATREAMQACYAGRARPPTRRRGPLRKILLQHHFMDGGLPIEQLFTPSTRYAFTAPDIETLRDPGVSGSVRHQAGYKRQACFRVAGRDDLNFWVTWHRLPAVGSYLKKLRLIGTQVAPAGAHKGHPVPARWEWSLQLTVEEPPTSAPEPRPDLPTAGIDLNWRVTDQGIRIGVLADTAGSVEALYLPERVRERWRFIQERQTDRDAALERAKDALKYLDDVPAGWHRALPMIRQGALSAWLTRVETDSALTSDQRRTWGGVLRQWAHADTEIRREIAGLWGHLIRERHAVYLQQAHEMCRRYQGLCLEDIDLRQLARDSDEKDPVLREANKHRQLVSLSDWRHCLRLIAPKYGTELVWRDPAGTTATCWECGAPVTQTGEIVLFCERQHGRDTDENAACWLRDGGPTVSTRALP